MNWSEFVLQAITILVPVAIAMIGQQGQIAKLKAALAETEKDNGDLRDRLVKLEGEYNNLLIRYERSLKAQAGMKDKF